MPEGIPPSDKSFKKRLAPRDLLLQEAGRRFEDFAETLEPAINGYFGSKEIRFTCKPGGWYIDLEKIEVNADPKFFIERGYSESEALFATFHEAEHFRDMIQDPETYERIFAYFKTRTDVHSAYPKALQRLYNCVDDVLVNRVVMTRWSAGSKAKDRLYPKLFPSPVLNTGGEPPTKQPRHRQFMYALLREAMMPNEVCDVDPEVREAINEWQERVSKSVKTLDYLTMVNPRNQTAEHTPEQRYDFMRYSLEPIFEALYRKDLEDSKQEKEEGDGANGEKGEPFEGDPFADAIPDPMDPDELFDKAQKINDALSKKKSDDFKNMMGVEKKDFEAYQKDFKKIEAYVDQLAEVFERVINRRKSYRRKLRKRVKEGPMIDSRLVATAYAEIKAGQTDPRIMLDYEKVEQIRNLPNALEFSLVCDGSGSVSGNAMRARLERQLAVLAMEAFARFRERIAKERRLGEPIDLDIKTETRIFSDTDIPVQPMTDHFDHPSRVRLYKHLLNMPGGGNNEPATFDAMRREQFGRDAITALQKGELKKIIIFLTDGISDKEAIQQKIRQLYSLAGSTKEGNRNLVVAGIGFAEGQQAVDSYAPNGYYADSFEKVIEIFIKIVEQILEDV
jgi:hypothetical protein